MNKRVSNVPPPAGPYDDIYYLFEKMANLLGAAEEFVKPRRAAGSAKEPAAAKDESGAPEPTSPQGKQD